MGLIGYQRTTDGIIGYGCVLYVCVFSLISGSAVRSAVTKLEGNSPIPWYVSPFHQLGSLKEKETRIQSRCCLLSVALFKDSIE